MSSGRSLQTPVTRFHDGTVARQDDAVVVEEPLEIRLGDTPLAVTMRTPGDDHDLVRGFLLTEGILLAPDEVEDMVVGEASQLSVRLRPGVQVDAGRFQRNMFVSSSCGVCGKASIEAVRLFARPARDYRVASAQVATLTQLLRERQPTFDATGGLHAAGLYELDGSALAVREDVGRHNAVDKAIGAASAAVWPLPLCLLVVSGRQSFEIVQKAAIVGVGGVIGVSAPSSLAVELARSLDILLVGFSRGDTFNVYAGESHLIA